MKNKYYSYWAKYLRKEYRKQEELLKGIRDCYLNPPALPKVSLNYYTIIELYITHIDFLIKLCKDEKGVYRSCNLLDLLQGKNLFLPELSLAHFRKDLKHSLESSLAQKGIKAKITFKESQDFFGFIIRIKSRK